MIRLSQNKDYGNLDYLGDRDLAIWMSWPNNAFHIATSSYNGDDWNRNGWFAAEGDILEKWMWIYLGYSWSQKKFTAFIRYDDKERMISWDGVNHYIPHKLYVDVGKDKFHSPYKGLVKELYVDVGAGAFRQAKFEDLHKKPISTALLADADVNNPRPNALYEVEAPLDDVRNVQEYSFSFYFRYSHFVPEARGVSWQRGNWLGIAGITETGDYSPTGWGDRALALFNWPWNTKTAYHFTTYNNPSNGNQYQDIDYDYTKEFDGSWNFIYFGYSNTEKRVFAFVRFGKTDRVASLNWNGIVHNLPPRLLKFVVGRSSGVYNMNGRYSSIKFNYKRGAFIGDENTILNSYLTNNPRPQT